MTAEKFVKKVLAKIRIDEIIVGKNFFFGRNKKGSLKDLKKYSGIYGYRVSVTENVKSYGRIISSTWIRSLILKGDLEKASRLLLRPVTVLGTVIEGRKRGRIIGYATANIDPHHEVIPPSGVYVVKIKLDNKLYKGILNIGIRPTFDENVSGNIEPTIEVHIFDFNKYIYGKDLEIIFLKKIRNEKKFRDLFHLRKQIEKDEKEAKLILS
ncbi:MAG: riboflavin biosynthesis protein RibF [Nitrospirae bacterium RBG_13_43_8]|nr:MAG: riboflavin biosynthesis protein RibF [Nitrospirae bacterium RBG_13_43_8]